MPEGTERIIGARSLAASHRRLHDLLRPGMSVLDVGCGTGAITRGVAERVSPGGRGVARGRVVGVDVGTELIEQARQQHGDVRGLTFEVGDAYELGWDAKFDVVTAARVLQWLAHPRAALQAMTKAARSGGHIVVLDYNHEKITWDPEPPAAMQRFYDAFLRWRASAGMDNAIADHLAPWFEEIGLDNVRVTPQHESVRRGDASFEQDVRIWEIVAATRGKQMVADGVITEGERAAAEREWAAWVRDGAQAQRMYLLAVEGTKS